jgi:hypothetical protein
LPAVLSNVLLALLCSYGTYWGNSGWFKIVRGGKYNPSCNFAVPALPALPSSSPAPKASSHRNEVKRTGTFKPVVTSPKPQDYVSLSAVPSDFTWCNVSGVNHCTTDLNQHIPK